MVMSLSRMILLLGAGSSDARARVFTRALRRCASERNIYALSVLLNLFADLRRQVRHGASVRLPFPAQPLVAVVKGPPAATS